MDIYLIYFLFKHNTINLKLYGMVDIRLHQVCRVCQNQQVAAAGYFCVWTVNPTLAQLSYLGLLLREIST